jgi:hypothetical protein|tara:strand:- start:41 stop:835 length:795 start_codon:yes stop_codon:yes gene_type:complete
MSTIKANNITAVDTNANLTLTGNGTGTVNLPTGFKVNNVANSFLSSATNVTVAEGGTGASTLAANGVLFGNGTSAVGATAVGTAAQVLTSNGSGVAPTFQDAGGGAWNLVTSGSLSSSELQITDITKYTRVIFICSTGGNSFAVQTSTDNGSSFTSSTGAYSFNFRSTKLNAANYTSPTYSYAASSTYAYLGYTGAYMQLDIVNPEAASNNTIFRYVCLYQGSTTTSMRQEGHGIRSVAEVNNAFRLYPTGGGITGDYYVLQFN